MRNIYFLIFSAVSIALGLNTTISAQTTYSAGSYTELSDAISNSASGDIINITGDILDLTGPLEIGIDLTINGNSHIISVPVPGLDEQGVFNSSPSGFNVFTINSGSLTINNLIIKGGNAVDGGAINIYNGSILYLNNCTVSNSASFGGGGGVFNDGTLFMKNSMVRRNAATYGGGIFNTGSAATFIESSTLSENRSTSTSGGGGGTENQGFMYLNNSTLSNNQSTEIGGAINNNGGTVYFVNSSATGNVAYGYYPGGAIGNNSGHVYIVNSLMAHNYTRTGGDVNNPTTYVLDDIQAYSGQSDVHVIYSIYHADLPAGIGTDEGNIQYTGQPDGSDNSIFSGGFSDKITNGEGLPIGDPVYRPFLYFENGSTAPTLKPGSFVLNLSNYGTPTRFANNDNVNPVVAYKSGTDWIDLTGTSTTDQEVTTDQVGTVRTLPARGSTEGTVDGLYSVKVLSTINGRVTGGTVYGEVYKNGATVTLTATPLNGHSFLGYNYILGGTGVASADNPYSFTVSSDVILQPVFDYYITYDGNGNTGGTVPATVTSEIPTTISDKNTLIRFRGTFTGWNTLADGSGTSYSPGNTYDGINDLYLYAQWNIAPLTWTGAAGNSNWNVSGNWDYGVVPASTDEVVIPDVTFDPIVNLAKSSPAYCKNLTIQSGAVLTIAAQKALTVNGIITNYAGTAGLVIKSDATGDGSYIGPSTQATVERYIPASAWVLLSSPVSSAVNGIYTGLYMKQYNESTDAFGPLVTATNVPLTPGTGSSIWSTTAKTISYTGKTTAGYIKVTTPRANQGFTLCGNPYTSAIDWNAASGWSKTNLAGTIWVWNQTAGQYATWNGTVGVNSGSRYLASGQGFFVQATASGATLWFYPGARLHNTISLLRSRLIEPELIRLRINGNGYYDETVIMIAADALATTDYRYDALKMPGSADAPQLSILKDSKSFTIVSLSSVDSTTVIPVTLKTGATGTYTLNLANTINTGGLNTFLVDKLAGTATRADLNPVYSFTASPSDVSDRFEIVFRSQSVITAVPKTGEFRGEIKIWNAGRKLNIEIPSNEELVNAEIYNLNGTKVKTITNGSLRDIDLNLSTGMYVVKVKTSGQVKTSKVVIM